MILLVTKTTLTVFKVNRVRVPADCQDRIKLPQERESLLDSGDR